MRLLLDLVILAVTGMLANLVKGLESVAVLMIIVAGVLLTIRVRRHGAIR